MATPRLLAAEPQLYVTDLERALVFYVRTLGFTEAFRHGEPAFYAQVRRDGAALNLRHADRPAFDAAFTAEEGAVLAATITVEGVETLYSDLEAAGARFHQPLRRETWGTATFIVADPDGNLVCFAG